MNAEPTDTRHSHLDLGDLIAGAAGQPIGDGAREHLASCERCQREANRWNIVADGVRGLAAATPQTAVTPKTASPARKGRTPRHVPTGPWRRAMLVAGGVAAALVLLVGIGTATGYVHVHLSGPGTETAFTAVIGCSQIEQADGTLEQVNGSSLVIKTASGQPVTVTTTATTFVSMSGALLNDITDGASVTVRGSSSDGTIQAAIVTIGQPFSAVNPSGFVPVQGTVADASTAGFTLVTSGGTRVPVTTSAATLVVIPHASPGQLRPGATIFAVGPPGPDGTLSATAVAAISQLPAGGHLTTSVRVRDCSPSSIQEALGAISVTHGSAG
jgi:predicted anti-sigma-YlaC factor YlaD